jgi:hypothetical protein
LPTTSATLPDAKVGAQFNTVTANAMTIAEQRRAIASGFIGPSASSILTSPPIAAHLFQDLEKVVSG